MVPTTKVPGVLKKTVNGCEIRKDGAWWMVVTYVGKSRKLYIIDQFKSRDQAIICAEEYDGN